MARSRNYTMGRASGGFCQKFWSLSVLSLVWNENGL